MMKHTLTAAALAAVLAAPAFAQTATPGGSTPPAMNKSDSMNSPATSAQSTTPSAASGQTFVQNQNATDWRGSDLIGATVYGPDNSSIGDINDVVIANDGKINAVVIGVGGFLGVGEKDVAIAFDKLSVMRKPNSASIDKVTVSLSKDELKNAPKFAYYDPAPTTTTGSGAADRARPLSPAGSPPASR